MAALTRALHAGRDEPARYALQVCSECGELPKEGEDIAVLEAANLWVAAIECGRGGDIGKVEPNGFLWPLTLAVRDLITVFMEEDPVEAFFNRFSFRLRWGIVHYLDRYPGFCWYKLVVLATYGEVYDWVRVLGLRRSAGWCAKHGEVAYCGKCNVTGLHQRLGGG